MKNSFNLRPYKFSPNQSVEFVVIRLNMETMENGRCQMMSGVQPKFKRRKFAAIRDFPPGCGRNVTQISSNHQQSVAGQVFSGNTEHVVEAGGLKFSEIRVESAFHEEVRNPVQEEKEEELDDLVRNVVASARLVNGFAKLSTNVEPIVVEQPKSVANNAVELSSEFHEVEVKASLKEELQEVKNQALVKEGSKMGEVAPMVKNVDETGNKTVLEIRTHSDGAVIVPVGKAKSWSSPQWPFNGGNIQEGTVPKNKLCRRTVVATRTFPPFCGRNAPQPSEDDRGKLGGTLSVTGDKSEWNVRDGNFCRSQLKSNLPKPMNGSCVVIGRSKNDVDRPVAASGKETVVSLHERRPFGNGDAMIRNKLKKLDLKRRGSPKICAKKSIPWSKKFTEKSILAAKAAFDESYATYHGETNEDSLAEQGPCDFNVRLPRLGPNSAIRGDVRNSVRETLQLFQATCRKILQGGEQNGKEVKRIDLLSAKVIKDKKKEVNTGIQIVGAVPGVEVGDEFQYRVELAIIGVHRLYQSGIDYVKQGSQIVAVSIVASGGYDDELDNADVLIYSGQGGNIVGKNKNPEDQKLKRGNLALKNSISARNPVRVIKGFRETKAADSSDARAKIVSTYVYDGLYMVEKYWQEMGPHGKLVFKFELRRIEGQPELAWKEVKKSKTREGLCVEDISGGEESFPIFALNTIDKQKPPPFMYVTRMVYPNNYLPIPCKGCDCVGGCRNSQICSCVRKNGGEIPYNFNGAIVESKPLVYECGPSCKCPPSCYNRVSQHGNRIQLEIFKTERRGWGVRSLSSISSGSFICEYIGEMIEDREAEQRTYDEYLFDIGQNYSDYYGNSDENLSGDEDLEDGGFTIDAAKYGNVGRFINHSCSPNLYAQNVLYDHEDKRMPHIMLFAVENIPPLKELTYHYNYKVDQVYDSNGNIKVKRCHCNSAVCSGRMY